MTTDWFCQTVYFYEHVVCTVVEPKNQLHLTPELYSLHFHRFEAFCNFIATVYLM